MKVGIAMLRVTVFRQNVTRRVWAFHGGWVALLWLAFPQTQAQGAFLSSQVVTEATNYDPFPFPSLIANLDTQTRADNGRLSFDQAYVFSGESLPGVPDDMTYSVSASAQSDYGLLRSSFNTSIDNIVFHLGNPDYDPMMGTGIPDAVGGRAVAAFQERITVTGAPELFGIRLVLRMTGELSQEGGGYPFAAGFASLNQSTNFGGGAIAFTTTSSPGAFDELVVSNPIFLIDGQAELNFSLETSAFWQVVSSQQVLANSLSVSSTVDFFNTVRVTEIQGFDLAGNEVAITSAIGESGTVYVANVVPEPASATLLFVGTVVLLVLSQFKRWSVAQFHKI